MTRVLIPSRGWTVRVWREVKEKELPDATWQYKGDQEIRDKIAEVKNFPLSYFVKAIAKLKDISAIEVVNEDGNGILFYPDWK